MFRGSKVINGFFYPKGTACQVLFFKTVVDCKSVKS